MTPFVSDPDFTLYVGDALEVLRGLPGESVHCCVTSPPYWGLRDYGTGSWEGGDPDHQHETVPARGGRGGSGAPGKQTAGAYPAELAVNACSCGATRVDRQIGLEPTPEAFVQAMVAVFREVRRVLRSDGTLWLNLGDSYASSPPGNKGTPDEAYKSSGLAGARAGSRYMETLAASVGTKRNTIVGDLKPKDLVGIPWRVAFALQADGWYLRSDIIWSKPNPMPESVTDRPTKAHEYLFLLSKSPRYFFDQEAVREPQTDATLARYAYGFNKVGKGIQANGASHTKGQGADGGMIEPNTAGRNLRSVWEIATQPYPQAHFATFPEALPERCIKAGTSERGCCPECGAPWVRQTDVEYVKSPVHGKGSVVGRHEATGANNFDGAGMPRLNKNVTTTGWLPSCWPSCDFWLRDPHERNPRERLDATVPCTILDPFMGSGTTALVARKLGRRSIGIELNESYARLAADRLKQLSLFAGDAA